MTQSVLLFMSGGDIALILGVALLLFGGKKLPELARGLGSGIKEFKDATNGTPADTAKSVAPQEPVQLLPAENKV
ncbi:twin-arginine translocase TatA/TatE family subunit [Mucilaginibacter sp. HMF5004]|uniref:Sec-independent protein translocase subunit TatA/TatB n=1 Tax=Mucilaginibacter rivuli TaxID=2857527 RepID=UPI001C5E0A53|nr:twin-arginine translocase TatA/TatE family subunit [Mucilaginibacter rivuli]MBW4890472.1 twin-arginine translocase TatA/TatE family subunit [Mucilaginibacter rivuli]